MEKSIEQVIKGKMQVVWVLWGVLLISQITLIVVGEIFLFKSVPEGMNETLVMVFSSIVLCVGALTQLLFSRAKAFINVEPKTVAEAESLLQKAVPQFIVVWGLGELITIFGLVLQVIAGAEAMQYTYTFFAAGVGLHLYRRPS